MVSTSLWKVDLSIDNEKDHIELEDIKQIFNGYLLINRTFFDELLEIVKKNKKYSIGKGISRVIGPDEEDWTMNSWLLIMFQDKERKIPFWFLFKREKDLSAHLVSLGPKNSYEYFKSSEVSDNEVKRVIEYLLAYPQKFELLILIPNYVE
jgi:hypothetical protein